MKDCDIKLNFGALRLQSGNARRRKWYNSEATQRNKGCVSNKAKFAFVWRKTLNFSYTYWIFLRIEINFSRKIKSLKSVFLATLF